MKNYISILFALALFYGSKTYAQESQFDNTTSIFTSVDEMVFVNANTSTLFTGETFYYKFFTWSDSTKELSKISEIGYVQLVNNEGKSVLKQKINLENGLGHGDFFVPTNLKTGNYKLLAYTKWMLNEPVSELFQMDILIVNPFMPLPEGMISETKKDSISNREPKSLTKKGNFSFVKQATFGTREKVEFALNENILETGNYSISVSKLQNLPKSESVLPKEFISKLNKNSNTPSSRKDEKFLPELRGELFSGYIENRENPDNLANKNIAISLPGKSFAFKTSSTNNAGQFWFILDPNPNTSQAVIQVMEEDRENYKLHLTETNLDFSNLEFEKFQLNSEMREVIEKRSTAVQIENAYYHEKRDSIVPEPESEPFYAPLAKEYILANYTSFPKLEETIVEIIPEMYSTKKRNKYSIHLRDYYNEKDQSLYGNTLVLVDGVLVQDVNPLFAYDTRKIEKISIVPKGYVYGAKIYNGIASFITKEQDFQSGATGDFILKTELLRPLPEKEYYNPEYAASATNQRIPDYRYQLLWMPEVTIAEPVSFYTSDVTGNFEIVLEGFSDEGKPVYLRQVIEVR
ncbi:MAG TPA: hypothetical protein VFM82_09150 [Flavobacteriaceae bacterium]|nr:hypothetical protein [Flavobacteriaceae bacterium]